jgi:hypothetical protein
MVLVHRRPALIPLIAEQVVKTWPDGIVQFTADRPSAAVVSACEGTAQRWPKNVELFVSPFPAISDKEHFDDLRAWQYERLGHHEPKYAAIWDDDHILDEPEWVRDDLARTGADLTFATKVQFWDNLLSVNERLPLHKSPFFFRCRPGDAFPTGKGRIIHAPAAVHDDPASVRIDLNSVLLDVGYLTADERARVFAMYARVGKIDSFTRPLMEPPQLITWGGVASYWHNRLLKVLC